MQFACGSNRKANSSRLLITRVVIYSPTLTFSVTTSFTKVRSGPIFLGQVTPEDTKIKRQLEAATTRLTPGLDSEPRCECLAALIDKNGDGMVDYQEFMPVCFSMIVQILSEKVTSKPKAGRPFHVGSVNKISKLSRFHGKSRDRIRNLCPHSYLAAGAVERLNLEPCLKSHTLLVPSDD